MKNDKTNPNPSAESVGTDTYEIYQIEDTRGVDYCFRDYASAMDQTPPTTGAYMQGHSRLR